MSLATMRLGAAPLEGRRALRTQRAARSRASVLPVRSQATEAATAPAGTPVKKTAMLVVGATGTLGRQARAGRRRAQATSPAVLTFSRTRARWCAISPRISALPSPVQSAKKRLRAMYTIYATAT